MFPFMSQHPARSHLSFIDWERAQLREAHMLEPLEPLGVVGGLARLLAAWPEELPTHSAAPSPVREALFGEEDPSSSSLVSCPTFVPSCSWVAWSIVPHPNGTTHLSLLMELRGRCPPLRIWEHELRELTLPSPWSP